MSVTLFYGVSAMLTIKMFMILMYVVWKASTYDYLMYLLVTYPVMLPIGFGMIRYRDTYAKAMRFFKETGLVPEKAEACSKLLEVDSPELFQCKSALFDSCRGFHHEQQLTKGAEILTHVWLLIARLGITEQFQVSQEEEIKKLDQEIRSLRAMDTEVQGLRNQTRNLETLLEAKVDMKKAAKANSEELTRELESLRAKFSDLQVNNNQLSLQVSTLQAQVAGEEQIKAAFEEFKKREDDKVERRCEEMDARLDALSIDFDEEFYPHMLIAIASRRWVIGHGLRLAIMKCAESTELRQEFANVVSAGIAKSMSEGLKHGVEHGKAQLDLEVIEAYDP
ncbi:gypsy type transposase [Tanacetum coccineum]